jgi:hypothetical protein
LTAHNKLKGFHMNKCLLLVAGCLAGLTLSARADAQVWVAHYQPAVPVTTFFAPTPVVQTSFFAPAPMVGFQPTAVVRTRYRPIIGGTVTRVRPIYSPIVVNPVPVVFGY